MNINVSARARDGFWNEPDPAAGEWEYWDFSFQPPVQAGDELVFRFDGVAVARARAERVSTVQAPGLGRDGWRVWWKRSTFEDLRSKPASERPANTAPRASHVGGLFGGGNDQSRGRVI